jgi:lysophospholipase L1-like esterase
MRIGSFGVRAGVWLICASGMLGSGAARAQDGFALKDGDRVVFYGDSITAQNGYTRFVEDFVLTRYPKMNIMFFNAGNGGDRVTGGGIGPIDVRLERDVIAVNPTVVTIMLGMNDGGYKAEDAATTKKYEDGYRSIVKTIKARVPGVRIYLIEPSPYDEVTHDPKYPGYNAVLQHYGRILVQIAKDENVRVLDGNTPMVEELTKAKAFDAKQAAQIIPDGVHPSSVGHWVLADAIVKAWHITPVVSTVRIDAKAKTVTAERAGVIDLEAHGAELEWREADEALPLPLYSRDVPTHFLFQISDLADDDREMLTVTNLAAAKYRLMIDASEVGSFSAAELAAGVNLATLITPMVTQAINVEQINGDRAGIEGMRRQMLVQGKDMKDQAAGLKGLDDFADMKWREQKKRATPVQHVFHLVPVSDAH